jgi:hypothetical protein
MEKYVVRLECFCGAGRFKRKVAHLDSIPLSKELALQLLRLDDKVKVTGEPFRGYTTVERKLVRVEDGDVPKGD